MPLTQPIYTNNDSFSIGQHLSVKEQREYKRLNVYAGRCHINQTHKQAAVLCSLRCTKWVSNGSTSSRVFFLSKFNTFDSIFITVVSSAHKREQCTLCFSGTHLGLFARCETELTSRAKHSATYSEPNLNEALTQIIFMEAF